MLAPAHPKAFRLLAYALLGACTLFLLACAGPAEEEDPAIALAEWRHWRGPFQTGVSPIEGLPSRWNETSPNVKWRVPIPGQGTTTPIVSGGKIFLTTSLYDAAKPTDEQIDYQLLAYDEATGELLWSRSLWSSRPLKLHRLNTHTSAPAATDGRLVYVTFGPDLVALDFDGNVVWKTEVEADFATHTRYGIASPPVLIGDAVVLLQDREDSGSLDTGWLASYDRETGEERWRREWMDTCCAYSSPFVLETEGRERLLVPLSGRFEEVDPSTGEVLWKVDHLQAQLVGSLAIEGDVVCLSGGAHHDRGTVCYRLAPEGPFEELWSQFLGPAPHVASAVIYRGKLFMVQQGGRITAVEAETGKPLWRRRIGLGGFYFASLVAGDGKVFAVDTVGNTVVVGVEDKMRILGRNRFVGSGASPAVTPSCFLLRGVSELACLAIGAPTPVIENPVEDLEN